MRNIRHPLTDKSGLWKICGLIIPYQMYSAMIRSVKGLVSRLRRLSTLLIVLLSYWHTPTRLCWMTFSASLCGRRLVCLSMSYWSGRIIVWLPLNAKLMRAGTWSRRQTYRLQGGRLRAACDHMLRFEPAGLATSKPNPAPAAVLRYASLICIVPSKPRPAS